MAPAIVGCGTWMARQADGPAPGRARQAAADHHLPGGSGGQADWAGPGW